MKRSGLYKTDNGLLLKDENNFYILSNREFYISNNEFITAYDFNNKIYNFNDVMNLNLNFISLIKFKDDVDSDIIHEIYLKNALIHSCDKCAWNIVADVTGEKNYYYYHGIEYFHKDWLELPERMREMREEKLKTINSNRLKL
jgi:hypothetical protein